MLKNIDFRHKFQMARKETFKVFVFPTRTRGAVKFGHQKQASPGACPKNIDGNFDGE